jgi:membrane fusion protein (multidrug efflux system)
MEPHPPESRSARSRDAQRARAGGPRARLAALALLALGLGCREAQQAAPEAGTPVTVEPVAAIDLSERIEASGELLAKERAEIAAEVPGRVSEIHVEEGAAVSEGAPLLAIDPERRVLEVASARARLDEARAALAEEERELERVRELHSRKVASQTQLDQAATRVSLARSRAAASEADLGVSERTLRDSSVRAPFAGLIARRLVSRGEFVSLGQPLFELVSLEPLEVEFSVTEADSSRVAVGQRVELRVAPFPDEAFHASVTVVSPTIDPRTRTLRVKALLDDTGGRLRPGLFAKVDLGISVRRGVPMIPEEAVLQRVDGAVVFLIDGDERAQRRVVVTGAHREGRVEVASGLAIGDRIVTRGHRDLVDGALVAPRNPDGSDLAPPVASAAGAPAPAP